MSIRYFGEYLVSKKAISASDLVKALILQTKQLPHLAELAIESGYVSAEEAIQVFHVQQEKGLSFLWSLKEFKGADHEVVSQLEAAIEEKRTPLGQVLLNINAIDLKTLTMMLDDYLSQAQAPQAVEDIEVKQLKAEENLTSLFDEGEDLTYPEGMLAELEDLFDERKYRAVKVALSFIKDKNLPDAKVISKLIGDVSKILQPVLKFTSAIGLRHLKALLLHLLSEIEPLKDSDQLSHEEIHLCAENLSLCNEEIWKLRVLVCREFSEEKYATFKENRELFQRALKRDI